MQDERERQAIAQEAIRGVILRRRDDYARVLRELGGQLFARKGNVDKYFNLNHCGDLLKTSRGEKFICDLPTGHSGPHESGDWEWWDGGPEVRTAPGTRELMLRVATHQQADEDQRRSRIYWRTRDHIAAAPEREAVALRAANTRQGIERLWRTR